MLHFRFLLAVCNQSAKSVWSVFVPLRVLWTVVVLALTLGLTCAEATFTEILTPTPTPPPLTLGSGPVIVEFGLDSILTLTQKNCSRERIFCTGYLKIIPEW